MSVEVIPATEDQRPVIANLLQLYQYDFTEFLPLKLEEEGTFKYGHLALYWSDPQRFPFIVRAEGRLAGFALVKKGSDFTGDKTVWDMADFFILRTERRQKVGRTVAFEIWRRFPGPWEVRVVTTNIPALQFWESAITEFKGCAVVPSLVTRGEESRYIFHFDS